MELNNGESVDYSILILATGSRWAGPVAFGTTKSQILESVNSWRTKFADAQDIVFVGGGAIGLGEITLLTHEGCSGINVYSPAELSGEIKDQWPVRQLYVPSTIFVAYVSIYLIRLNELPSSMASPCL